MDTEGQAPALVNIGPAHRISISSGGGMVLGRNTGSPAYWKRYREWIENNRRQVHEATAGRVGYVHIPDMGPNGYAEFHRGYLAELDRHGLIVDVRFNGGGHVSSLILEKLARR